VVRERSRRASNFRAERELGEYPEEAGVPGLEGIDTRALVRRIRIHGAMKGVLSSEDLDDLSLVAKAKGSPGLVGRDLVQEVIPEKPIDWREPLSRFTHLVPRDRQPPGPDAPHVVALDYGLKWNIARHLFDTGCRVTVLPAFSVQYHPEASAGPHDSQYLFERFREMLA